MLDEVAAAESRLVRTVAAMTDGQAAGDSRLPGWSRAMLVTHIARNASSNAGMVAAALLGEQRAQYPGGPEERAAQIEAGRGRSAAEVLADLHESAAEWAAVMAIVRDDQWELVVPAGVGPRPIAQRVKSRLLEVEVHHADLGLGYSYRDWPDAFVAAELDRTVARIGVAYDGGAVRAEGGVVAGPPAALLAWLLGRESVESAGLAVSGDSAVAVLPARFPI